MTKKLYTLLIGGLLGTLTLQGQVVLQALDAPEQKPVVPPLPPFVPPPGVTLDDSHKFFTSLYDEDYLPFTLPTTPATWNRPIAADGNKDVKLIDYQGVIPTEGVHIRIPYKLTITNTEIRIPAYRQQITISSDKIEGGTESQDIILEWKSQTLSSSYTYPYISATLKAVDKPLNIKKLDLNGGLGDDYKGVLLGTFTYQKSNGSTEQGKFEVRAISAIPDKNFEVQTTIDGVTAYRHQFLYIPIKALDGRIWFNNNLGADYANINSPHFNPAQQAEALFEKDPSMDYKAYGSLFQWGREADGHELMTYTSYNRGHPTYPSIKWLSYKELPGGVFSGLGYYGLNPNDPCPNGFRMPAFPELLELLNVGVPRNQWRQDVELPFHLRYNPSNLMLPASGFRFEENGGWAAVSGENYNPIMIWALNIRKDYSSFPDKFAIDDGNGWSSVYSPHFRTDAGLGVRCIKDYPLPPKPLN